MALVIVDDGTRINVEADPGSSKPALVFSNSLGTDHRLWDPQVAPFREKFRLIRYDTRGHGKSDAPKGPYSIERLGRDVLAILDHFEITKAYYCGLSLGGMTGMWLGVNAGDRLIRLALCDCAAKVPSPDAFRQRAATVRTNGIAGIIEGILERWFTEPFRKTHPEALAPFRDTLLKSNPNRGSKYSFSAPSSGRPCPARRRWPGPRQAHRGGDALWRPRSSPHLPLSCARPRGPGTAQAPSSRLRRR